MNGLRGPGERGFAESEEQSEIDRDIPSLEKGTETITLIGGAPSTGSISRLGK